MEKFLTGNVVKIKDSIVIINKYRTIERKNKENYKVVSWISFSMSNVSGTTRLESYEYKDFCYECDSRLGLGIDNDCKNCKGTGYYIVKDPGMSEAIILADNVKKYIKKCLFKNFDF